MNTMLMLVGAAIVVANIWISNQISKVENDIRRVKAQVESLQVEQEQVGIQIEDVKQAQGYMAWQYNIRF